MTAVLWTTVAVALALLATSISLRLLGVRRGWGSALLSGVIGWGAAVVLALALADWELGADDLLLHILVIGVPATMAAAVALDLLARPGSLAVGERAALVVRPRPLQAVRLRVATLRRYRELVELARREGFGPSLAGERGDGSGEPVGIRLRRLLEAAGGVYIKLGQIAATRVDILPADVCAELAMLQNRVPPEPVEDIKPILEAELGGSVDDVFAEFDWQPLAAASIGQTYRARLRTGEPVVVKIQRPGVEDLIERDLAALGLLAGLAQRRTVLGQGIRSAELLEQFGHSLRAELDFLGELEAMVDMTALLGENPMVRIPKVYEQFSTRRVLVQERFEGMTLAEGAELERLGIDRTALAERLLLAALDQTLRIGFFHADPHPGNIFVLEDGSLGLIDFGAVGRFDPIQREAVRDMLIAIVGRDAVLLRDSIERVADIDEAIAPRRLERALGRLMAESIRPTGSLEPDVLQQLVRTLSEFGVRLPRDLVLLSRTLVTLDGTLRTLAPGFSMGAAAIGFMGDPNIRRLLDPQALIQAELLATLPHLGHLPARIDQVLTLAARGSLRVNTALDESGGRVVRTLVNRALLLAIGAVFVAISAILLVAADQGPMVTSGTGLFEIFGYGGLLAGTVLLLRVAAAIARDGTT